MNCELIPGCPGNLAPLHRVHHHRLDRAVQHAIGVNVNAVGFQADQQQAEGKQGGEDNAQRCRAVDAPKFSHGFRQERREDADDDRSREHGGVPRRLVGGGRDPAFSSQPVHQQKRANQPQQHGVAQGVPHHALATQHKVIAGQRASHGREGAGHDNPGVDAAPVGKRGEKLVHHGAGAAETGASMGCGLGGIVCCG
jgi:hypothetical protein